MDVKKCFLLAMVLCALLTACGQSGEETQTSNSTNPSVSQQQSDSQDDVFAAMKEELAALPEDFSGHMPQEQGYYVIGDQSDENMGILRGFIEQVNGGEAASIRAVQYTIEGDALLTAVDYDGTVFRVVQDSTRDEFGSGMVTETEADWASTFMVDDSTFIYCIGQGELPTEEPEGAIELYRGPAESLN